jgi:NTP pyrophosphatase (non-canonical NTP hydrolase)
MKKTITEIIDKFGETNQLIIAMEECSELIKEVSKYIRTKDNKEHLTEELADVCIMIEQIRLIVGINELELYEMIQKKLKRTRERYLKRE